MTAIAWRLRRLPPTARRMVARPTAITAPFNWSQRAARRAHFRESIYIVTLVGMSSLAIAVRARTGVWLLLWALAATVALRGLLIAIGDLVGALRLIDRRQERLERRLLRDAARGRYPTIDSPLGATSWIHQIGSTRFPRR